MADYSIWVVEYARVVEFAQGILKYGDWNTGTRVAPYCYAVLKSDGHVAVVDTGYNHVELGEVLARSYGVSDWQPADVVLKRIGIDPADVDTMILTHNHFDHAGRRRVLPQRARLLPGPRGLEVHVGGRAARPPAVADDRHRPRPDALARQPDEAREADAARGRDARSCRASAASRRTTPTPPGRST